MDTRESPSVSSTMDFRRKKLYWASGIMTIGMIVALLWHSWQGWVLHQDYPYNTFLFRPKVRFSDFTIVLTYARSREPYLYPLAGYFPAVYLAFRPLAYLNEQFATYLFLIATCLGLWAVLIAALQPLLYNAERVFSSSLLLLLFSTVLAFSYPLLFCLDRGNVEIILGLSVATGILCFRYQYHRLGLLALFPAICFKFYPILLTAVFLRPKHLLKVLIVGAAFVFVTTASMAAFAYPLATTWELWNRNLQNINAFYVIYQGGAAGTASPWNVGKAVLGILYYYIASPKADDKVVPSEDFFRAILPYYTVVALLGVALTIIYTVLVEREFFRRIILILIVNSLIVPSGGEYRLLYANMALIVLILLPQRRRHDLLATALLAFVVMPKREAYLTFLGISDSGSCDIPVSILMDVPCMFTVMALLIKDGFKPGSWHHLQQRAGGLVLPYWRLLFRTTLVKSPVKAKIRREKNLNR